MQNSLVIKPKTKKIYKSNKLNNANFETFNHSDYQVFLSLLSKIGGVDEKGKYVQPENLEREYSLTASEFGNIFKLASSHCYTTLKKAVDRLLKADIKIKEPDNPHHYSRINICSKAKYMKNEGRIDIKFTDDIMPYLAQVKEKFTIYNLKEVSNFSSLYTTRMYELIQEFKETGWMIKSIDQLREAFAVGEKYKHYGHFKSKTFSVACDEINRHYAMGLQFEEIKEGKKVKAIRFFFKKTIVHEVTNQYTGKTKNFYEKPEQRISEKPRRIRKKVKNNFNSQTPKKDKKKEEKTLKKRGIFSSFFSKIFR